ncbi:MAG: dinitrogenase iron-molybdenum cofactor biosynthesis domain-containing protein [Desulfobacter sp.]|nr:dinitrogenase iron-molybdenum cofactor biosynthesis domain-containing protein [Desulfobacter sp.]WDP86491.1 MAG: dinitrogenase iron-molybdenum cofactor biosynthesis domain-containing protein [Desulfobacter sp.]
MKIAITAWGNRVSPVFDAARTLLIADIKGHTIKSKTYVSFHPDDIQDLAALLSHEQVSTLICGAISTEPSDQIAENHIRLISFVSGNALDILNSFASRYTIDQSHMMPGCSLDYSRR